MTARDWLDVALAAGGAAIVAYLACALWRDHVEMDDSVDEVAEKYRAHADAVEIGIDHVHALSDIVGVKAIYAAPGGCDLYVVAEAMTPSARVALRDTVAWSTPIGFRSRVVEPADVPASCVMLVKVFAEERV